VGKVMRRFGSTATIIVMSDHGFCHFSMQFNLNSWLRQAGWIPKECKSLRGEVDWSKVFAYGLGLNGLYINLKGRERDGIVEPGEEYEALVKQLARDLEAVRDEEGLQVVSKAYRASEVYSGEATALAPDLIVGYARGFRASWDTPQGDI